jgi:hypothetical protein
MELIDLAVFLVEDLLELVYLLLVVLERGKYLIA